MITSLYFVDRFSVVEMKRIYRGFKTECPTGLITEEAFHGIYSRFFPQGGKLARDCDGDLINMPNSVYYHPTYLKYAMI